MDEEEKQQSDSKISVSSFFERVDSVDKVANRALSKANANFDIINNQKTLINSINISIEALETKVRDIANYIIIEKRIEKDAEEDRLFEQQDEAQKGSMLERLAGLKSNNESEQTQAAGEEPKKGGGGILGTLLSLGIGAFALKFLWPAILPAVGGLLKGALAKFAVFSIGGLGGLIKGILVGSGLTGIGFLGIGALIEKFANKTDDSFKNAGESAAKKIEEFKFNEKGEVSGGEGTLGVEGGTEGGTEGGGEEIVKENLVNGDKSMRATLTKKDLIAKEETKEETKDPRIESEFDDEVYVYDTGEFGPDKEDKDIQPGDTYGIAEGLPYNYLQQAKQLPNDRERLLAMAEKYPQDKERYLKRAEKMRLEIIEFDKRYPQVTELLKGEDKQYYENMKNYSVESEMQNDKVQEIQVATENKDLDLSLSESFSEKLQPLNNQIETLNEFTTGATNTFEETQLVARPVNNPNTTVTFLKSTSSNTPFTNLMSNKHLSLNKTQEAELLRYIK